MGRWFGQSVLSKGQVGNVGDGLHMRGSRIQTPTDAVLGTDGRARRPTKASGSQEPLIPIDNEPRMGQALRCKPSDGRAMAPAAATPKSWRSAVLFSSGSRELRRPVESLRSASRRQTRPDACVPAAVHCADAGWGDLAAAGDGRLADGSRTVAAEMLRRVRQERIDAGLPVPR